MGLGGVEIRGQSLIHYAAGTVTGETYRAEAVTLGESGPAFEAETWYPDRKEPRGQHSLENYGGTSNVPRTMS